MIECNFRTSKGNCLQKVNKNRMKCDEDDCIFQKLLERIVWPRRTVAIGTPQDIENTLWCTASGLTCEKCNCALCREFREKRK